MRMRVIRSNGRAPRLLVNTPIPSLLPSWIQFREGVRWKLQSRSELRLVRMESPTPAKGVKNRRWGFFSRI